MKVTGFIQTNRVGSKVTFEVEIPDGDLEGLTREEMEKLIDEAVQEQVWGHAEWGWRGSVE